MLGIATLISCEQLNKMGGMTGDQDDRDKGKVEFPDGTSATLEVEVTAE